MNKREIVKKAFTDTLPVFAGYIVLGIGFGVLLKLKGFGLPWAFFMSLLIFAGSMQYVGVGLLATGSPLLTVAVTTVLVNARHLFYGISMIDKYKDVGKRKLYLIFALSDETYSILCHQEYDTTEEKKLHTLLVSLMDQTYWIIGCCVGSVLGGLINFNAKGIDFALTALFVTILTQQWLSTKNHVPVLIGIIATAVCRVFIGPDKFLIPSMVCIIVCMSIYRTIEKKKEDVADVA